MGLDWCLQSTEEGKSPLEHIGAERCDLSNPKHIEICNDIIRSYRANARNDYWDRSDKELRQEMEGKILVDTLDTEKNKVALAALGNILSIMTGVEAFRGKMIQYCELVSSHLVDKAFEEMDSEDMSDYANQLRLCIPNDGSGDAEEIEILQSACAWLEFWAQFPVRMVPWY